MLLNKSILIVLLVFSLNGSFGQSNLFNHENTLAYANHLFDSKKYLLAKDEYSRLHFLEPKNEYYQSRLLNSFLFSKNINDGLAVGKTFYESDNLFPKLVAKDFLHLLFNSEYRYRTQVFLNSNTTFNPSELWFYKASNFVLEYKIDSAQNILSQQKEDESENMMNLRTIVAQDYAFNPKSKGLAIAMSTFVPGLGKVYASSWKDGLAVFVYTSLSAWQSYRGFNKKGVKSFYGWMFASVGTGFYLGNIYGTIKAIRLRREKHESIIKQQVKNVVEASFN